MSTPGVTGAPEPPVAPGRRRRTRRWRARRQSSIRIRRRRRRSGIKLGGPGYAFSRNPGLLVVSAFFVLIAVGTIALSLPRATAAGTRAPLLTAMFTSTSAVSVTGLATVDPATYWSRFGQVEIMILIQVGGFGIMTLASLLGLMLSRRIGLRMRLNARQETGSVDLGDVRRVITGVAITTLIVEGTTAVLLTIRLWTAWGEPFGTALWHGIFHAISSFNNAGVALWPGGMTRFVADWWVSLVICASIIVGGLGFPVLFELRHEIRKRGRWSLHTKITVYGTVILLVVGTLGVLLLEWRNPNTLGDRNALQKLLPAFFQSVQPRTAGFNTLDYSQMNQSTWLLTDALSFIGTGSASTGGGLKITTFTILMFVILAQARGQDDVNCLGRRIPDKLQREALTVALLFVALALSGSAVLMVITPYDLDRCLFEVISALSTVGLTTGITGYLGPLAQCVLMAIMFIGRVGPAVVAAALAVRERPVLYRLPEERTLVG